MNYLIIQKKKTKAKYFADWCSVEFWTSNRNHSNDDICMNNGVVVVMKALLDCRNHHHNNADIQSEGAFPSVQMSFTRRRLGSFRHSIHIDPRRKKNSTSPPEQQVFVNELVRWAIHRSRNLPITTVFHVLPAPFPYPNIKSHEDLEERLEKKKWKRFVSKTLSFFWQIWIYSLAITRRQIVAREYCVCMKCSSAIILCITRLQTEIVGLDCDIDVILGFSSQFTSNLNTSKYTYFSSFSCYDPSETKLFLNIPCLLAEESSRSREVHECVACCAVMKWWNMPT